MQSHCSWSVGLVFPPAQRRSTGQRGITLHSRLQCQIVALPVLGDLTAEQVLLRFATEQRQRTVGQPGDGGAGLLAETDGVRTDRGAARIELENGKSVAQEAASDE